MKLSEAITALIDAGIDSARHDATELFMRIGGLRREELLSPDAQCNAPELIEAIEKRKSRFPLQYIIGEVGFYRETYEVSKDCLIPRSDTEILVEEVIKRLPDGERFIDICTGSGCIAISTLKNTNQTLAFATDISERALLLAKRNALKNGVERRVEFIRSDALSEVCEGDFFAIVSNPPYVTSEEYKALEPELYFEPKIALVGNEGGLEFYKKITKNYVNSLKNGGFFAFEIGSSQAEDLKLIAKENGLNCEIIKDYSGLDRVAILQK